MAKRVTYVDGFGRKFLMEIPDSAPDEHAPMGIQIGPPNLESLGLPLDLEVRLNNSLYARGLFTDRDLNRKRGELLAVWQSVLHVDTTRLINVYKGVDIGS